MVGGGVFVLHRRRPLLAGPAGNYVLFAMSALWGFARRAAVSADDGFWPKAAVPAALQK